MIHRRSKQQPPVAQSSKESEFISMALFVPGILYLQKFTAKFVSVLPKSTIQNLFYIFVAEDNQAFISGGMNLMLSELSTHIDLKYCFLFDNVQKRNVELSYVKTKYKVTNILSKKFQFKTFIIW